MALTWGQFLAVGLILANEALCSTMLFPFVGLFVGVLDPAIDRNAAGYSGLLIGAFQGAQTLFCSRWGHLSDAIGRKPVFILGLLFGSGAVVLMGTSTTLWQAVLFRILHGSFSANAPVAKTYVSEISEPHEQARAFGMLSVCWSIGAFVGPMIGGFLYDPSTSPLLSGFSVFGRGSVFAQHPALLPCLVVSLYTIIAAVLVHLFLPESNPRAVSLSKYLTSMWRRHHHTQVAGSEQLPTRDAENSQELSSMVGSPQQTRETRAHCEGEVQTLTTHELSAPDCAQLSEEDKSATTLSEDEGDDAPEDGSADFSWSRMFAHPILQRCVPMYMTLCAFAIIYNEVLPLYAIALVSHGGLEMTSTDIGVISSINAAISVGCNLIFPYATARVSTLVLWRWCCVVFAVSMFLYGITTHLNALFHSKAVNMGWISLISCFRCLSSTWMFSLSMMFVANAAPPVHLGRVTGMAHACGSLMRSLWPLTAAPMFAWSISAPRWFPLNHYFVFILSSAMAVLGYYLSLPLREDDVIKKRSTEGPVAADEELNSDDYSVEKSAEAAV